ncbi:pyruvate dehydrogenase (acetyl-transferring) E1 component subunit alpha [Agromyces sp. ISL-38]|uniref:pyruvate dehydrogenase (acetyl-transferring) E1 component subunit alpha n=1 Tax=Agromyces sp. ISL-38 TaxID=2819107 RepID=UPI001BE89CC8|nr:pyruvate dehydrogenase (acetyl-transferring) E1 component subunit alpha [Agromyces sp. ISL-38]MBT2500499.1 pyruvate dehydrogenase (acetyl-transferring) E1 component subunit alpha [Agromyces sp. ISL-38]MBT2519241.1 pyruvate dehydrogenase (acetyl-transferring) E1 component subunit alpha [Streptomyces sp. ISL-90]
MNPSDRDATGLLTRPDDFVQLVTPTGERRADADFDPWVSDVDTAALGRLYRDMAIVRRLDTEATALQRQGELGLWPPLAGQEAAQIGSARAMRDDDFAFTSYREHGVAWCRGVGPAELLTVWRGTAASGWNPFERGIAVPQIIIGAQTLHATGWAMGATWEGSDAAAIAYFGDGATSEGDVSEALIFAASFNAPVVFFCQNNQWAISEPVGLQSKQPLARRADGFGMPGIRVDGNDVLAVLAATRIALDRARRGEGPTFIEAVTYRLGPHTTADDPTRYRTEAELDEWRGRDPLTRVLALLEDSGVDSAGLEREVAAEADRAAAELRSACIAIADPEPLSVFDHVYVEPNSHLERQRTHYVRYLATFEETDATAAGGAGAGTEGGAR